MVRSEQALGKDGGRHVARSTLRAALLLTLESASTGTPISPNILEETEIGESRDRAAVLREATRATVRLFPVLLAPLAAHGERQCREPECGNVSLAFDTAPVSAGVESSERRIDACERL